MSHFSFYTFFGSLDFCLISNQIIVSKCVKKQWLICRKSLAFRKMLSSSCCTLVTLDISHVNEQCLNMNQSQHESMTMYHRWNDERLKNATRLRTFITDIGTHTPGMALPRTAWVPPNASGVVSPPLLTQMGYGPFCDLWVWRKGSDRWTCCPSLSNPSSSYRTYGLTVLDDETIEMLLNTGPETWYSVAVD